MATYGDLFSCNLIIDDITRNFNVDDDLYCIDVNIQIGASAVYYGAYNDVAAGAWFPGGDPSVANCTWADAYAIITLQRLHINSIYFRDVQIAHGSSAHLVGALIDKKQVYGGL